MHGAQDGKQGSRREDRKQEQDGEGQTLALQAQKFGFYSESKQGLLKICFLHEFWSSVVR